MVCTPWRRHDPALVLFATHSQLTAQHLPSPLPFLSRERLEGRIARGVHALEAP
jgi:hypothetical protein